MQHKPVDIKLVVNCPSAFDGIIAALVPDSGESFP